MHVQILVQLTLREPGDGVDNGEGKNSVLAHQKNLEGVGKIQKRWKSASGTQTVMRAEDSNDVNGHARVRS